MSKIAIIGMSGLFPGSSTLEQFWNNLIEAKDLTGLATEEDFGQSPSIFFEDGKGVVDKCYSTRGGYIRDFHFEPGGYALDADYLSKQDKLYQWSLHVAKEALAHSGYLKDETARKNCGLVLGNLSFPTGSSHKLLSRIYSHTLEQSVRKLLGNSEITIPGHVKEMPDNRVLDHTPSELVAKALSLGKTHYALDAACATSLYAIKLACDELQTGKADFMLAGAVCGSDQLFIHMGFSIFHAYAPMDQKFVPLDKNSAGLVSAEGAGIVVLKRLEDAERDGDKILGVIGGIGLSNDGRGKFLLSPNPKGQKLAFQRAYDFKEIFPKDTTYLECHATGTPLGDVTEMNSIADFFQKHQTQPALGSVKSNMGHLLTAAGMSGLLKVLLAMEKEVIPPNINLTDAVEADNGWLTKEQMILQAQAWNDTNKQAGINSFGFGGTNAHMVVQNYKGLPNASKSIEKASDQQLKPMSIIGMDVHFGDCTSLDEFYQTIFSGRQHFRELPPQRWKGFEENEALLKAFGFADGKPPKSAYIDHFEIDLLRYKIQPKEAETLEPQQALMLKVADNALKDAGLDESQNVAVLIAMESELAIHHYLARWDVGWQLEQALAESGIDLTEEQKNKLQELARNMMYYREGSQSPSQHTSFVGNIMASRIAALWDFNGPAFTISCGENSVFKALEVAQNLLSQGEVDAVVVGGVDFSAGFENVLLRNQYSQVNQAAAPSLPHNEGESGWLIGEGAGAIVLRASDAVLHTDTVYAKISGIGQQETSIDAGLIELAATGFAAQDEAELKQLLSNSPQQATALGSVKSNIGHTFAASGIASLIKVALCLHHRFIPAVPNWKAPKQLDDFAAKTYYFPSQSRPWISSSERKALVYGLEGLQVEVSEVANTQERSNQSSSFFRENMPALIPLLGQSEADLQRQLSALDVAIESEANLASIAQHFYQKYAEQKVASEAGFCLVITGKNKTSISKDIHYFQKTLGKTIAGGKTSKTPSGSYFTARPLGKKGKLAFVYPGSGTAYTGIGQALFQLFPALHGYYGSMVDDLNAYVHSEKVHPQTLSADTKADSALEKDAIALMSVGVFYAAAYTHILRHYFKIEPDVAFGYSMGECSSMWYALGLWDPRHAHIFQNSPIFKDRFAGKLELLAEEWNISTVEAQQRWASYSVLAPRSKVEEAVKQYERVYLTFINTEKEVVIAGDKTQCQAVIQQLDCHSIQLPFQNIIHNDFCNKERSGLLEMHDFQLENQPNIEFYSSLSLAPLPFDRKVIAENSTAVCHQLVDFPRLVKAVAGKGNAKLFVELGAHATCTGWIKETLKDQEHLANSMNQRGKSDVQSLSEVLAQLLSHGVEMDVSYLYAGLGEEKAQRTFAKKIIPGGHRIYDYMLTDQHQQLFASYATVTKSKALVESVSTRQLQAASTTFMESNIIERETGGGAISQSDKRIGENGLILQDYAAGEHLEGKEIIFSQEDLEEFAAGKISKVFGPEYSIIDSYSRRVMLPMHPYLLVSRVTGLRGQINQYKPSFMQTEYDIPYNAWFTTDGQIPWAVSVESGQCDLLLISYLGIDFQNKGDLVYRLLDCTLTFVDDLPFEGQTLRYDISINSFVRNGDNLLFFFSYRCYVQDRLVLKMDGGCAGFFTDEQLEEGNGVVYTDEEISKRKNAVKRRFTPLLKTDKTQFSKEDLQHLINNEPEKCFGDISYYRDGRNPSLCLPPEKILMIDRITQVDIHGGAYGLGFIEAEKDLHPDDWFFPCHFRDDEVLAGSLQAEGGGNLLRFFMLYLGLQRLVKDGRYQPVFDLPQKVRCRKQVTTKDTKLVYRLEIKEIGLVPNPYVIGDLEIISDGIVTVHFENLGLQLREKDNPKYLEEKAGVPISPRSEGALLNEHDITTFALDDLSRCFGPDFAVYDGRTVSRQPNTDLQLISRVVKIEGERGNFKQASTIYAEYDVPQDAWYYEQNSSTHLPYSVLMEIALQPCGLLGAYLGSTLQFADKNLYFRNLDGTGEMLDLPAGTDFRGKTITNKAVLVSSVALGGTILQNYTFECAVDGQVFYRGKSSFGFFPGEALATQVGLDNGTEVAPWFQQQNLSPNQYQRINLDSPYGKFKLFRASPEQPQLHLAGNQLNFLDHLIIAKESGEHGKGYIYASKEVRTYDWFFTCHFYQDPVMPGSLGVEAILQAMQTFVLKQGLAKDIKQPQFEQLAQHTTVWKYRGQILLDVKMMQLEVHLKSIEKQGEELHVIGDAYLWRDGMRIYQLTDLGLRVHPSKG